MNAKKITHQIIVSRLFHRSGVWGLQLKLRSVFWPPVEGPRLPGDGQPGGPRRVRDGRAGGARDGRIGDGGGLSHGVSVGSKDTRNRPAEQR